MKGYYLKITVKYTRPKMWREVIVTENTTFYQLHKIIQTIMHLADYHMYLFRVHDTKMLISELEHGAFDMWEGYLKYESKETLIGEYFEKYGKMFYWYDFGDDWEFDIELREIIDDYDKSYPTLKRHRGKYNLLEDCRAVGGWSEGVEILENPDKEVETYGFEWTADYITEYNKEHVQETLKNMFDG